MAGWDDYFVTTPILSEPNHIIKGISYALCERKEVVDSSFHAACLVDKDTAYYNKYCDWIIHGDAFGDDVTSNEHFGIIERDKYVFYEEIDDEIYQQIINLEPIFVKSNGSSFASLSDLAGYAYDGLTQNEKALTQSSLVLGSNYYEGLYWAKSTLYMTPLLQSKWAIQRRNMINALVYCKKDNVVTDYTSTFTFKK